MPDIRECREIVRQLWPYLDGALPEEYQERIATHLTGCVGCRSHYDFERAFLAAVRATRHSAITAELEPLRERIVTRLVKRGYSAL